MSQHFICCAFHYTHLAFSLYTHHIFHSTLKRFRLFTTHTTNSFTTHTTYFTCSPYTPVCHDILHFALSLYTLYIFHTHTTYIFSKVGSLLKCLYKRTNKQTFENFCQVLQLRHDSARNTFSTICTIDLFSKAVSLLKCLYKRTIKMTFENFYQVL